MLIVDDLIKLKRKVFRNLSDYGFVSSLKKIITRVFGIFYKRINIIVYRIEIGKNVTGPITNDQFTFSLIDGRSVLHIKMIEKMAEWLEGKIDSDLSTGKKICMTVFDKERLIGFYLAGFEKIYLPTLSITVILKEDEVWGEEIMIDKEYRRKGLATLLKKRIYKELQNRGIKSVYGHVGLYNKASLKSAGKFQLEKVFYVRFLKIFKTIEIIISEISINLFGQDRKMIDNWLSLNPYHIIKKTIVNKHNSIFNLKNKKDEKYLFRIKTSDLM